MSIFSRNNEQDAFSDKEIESVQIIKILYQTLELNTISYCSKDYAANTAFVCLVVYTDGTKRMDVVNLEDLNKKYIKYLLLGEYNSL